MEGIVNHIVTAVKGFFMGAANVVPGVSGGTIALISGIYARIIEALNAILSVDTWKELLHGNVKAFWKKIDGWFLLSLGIGIVLSVFTLAKLLEYCLQNSPVATWAFFFGLILASAFFMISCKMGIIWYCGPNTHEYDPRLSRSHSAAISSSVIMLPIIPSWPMLGSEV